MKHLTRQWELLNPQQTDQVSITIVGAGAIGGWTTLMLAKMGYKNIRVIDFDVVDEENINNQFYRFSDIGKLKVDALKEMVKDYSGIDITVVNGRWAGESSSVTIMAVDSMKVRKEMYDKLQFDFACSQIIDARMGAEQAMMYSFPNRHTKLSKAYETSLYTDEEAVHERCTAKATVYTASLIGGQIAKNVKDITLQSLDRVWSLVWNINTNDLLSFKLKDSI